MPDMLSSAFIRPSAFVLAVSSFAAAEMLPWEHDALPPAVVQSALQPDWVFCEDACDWRKPVADIFRPLVRECATAREAVLTIASQMTAATGVYYSMERRKANMNALEALREKKVSCTGQSVLLVCALRSVGIPARVVWVLTWNHMPGNHTWVEAWVDGGWQMIEFNEKAFNTPWVMEYVGMLDEKIPAQRIIAVGGTDTGGLVPFQIPDGRELRAEDVTARYRALSRAWYEQAGLPPDCQRLMVDVRERRETARPVELHDESGRVISRALLPTLRDDVRRCARLLLPRNGRYYLKTDDATIEVTATEAPVRIIRLLR